MNSRLGQMTTSDSNALGSSEQQQSIVRRVPTETVKTFQRDGPPIDRHFNNPDFSDLIIEYGTSRLYVHKIVLVINSWWFETAFNGSWSESKTDVIRLADEPIYEPALLALFRHMYGMAYKEDEAKVDFAFDVLVYIMADKYGVQTLCHAIAQRPLTYIAVCNVESTLYKAVELVFAHTFANSQLFDLYLSFCVANEGRLSINKRFRSLVKEAPEILADVWLKATEDSTDDDVQMIEETLIIPLGTVENPYGID